MPSTITRIFVHGRRVRGRPIAIASRRMRSRSDGSLCANVRMCAPLARAPLTIEVWFSASEMMSEPFEASAGIVVELVP